MDWLDGVAFADVGGFCIEIKSVQSALALSKQLGFPLPLFGNVRFLRFLYICETALLGLCVI